MPKKVWLHELSDALVCRKKISRTEWEDCWMHSMVCWAKCKEAGSCEALEAYEAAQIKLRAEEQLRKVKPAQQRKLPEWVAPTIKEESDEKSV